MRWKAQTGMLCALLACAWTAMAGGDAQPRHRSTTDHGTWKSPDVANVDSTAFASARQDAAPADLAALESIVATRSPQTSENNTQWSPDGSSFRVDVSRVDASVIGRLEAAMLEALAARGGGCGDPEAGSCCEANGTPCCDDMDCCAIICYVLGFSWCCDEEGGGWDDMCAAAAQEICGDLCGPPTAALLFRRPVHRDGRGGVSPGRRPLVSRQPL